MSQRPALYLCRRNLLLLLSVSPLAFWRSAPDLAKAWRADSPHARMKAMSPDSAPIPSPWRRAPPLPPSADRTRAPGRPRRRFCAVSRSACWTHFQCALLSGHEANLNVAAYSHASWFGENAHTERWCAEATGRRKGAGSEGAGSEAHCKAALRGHWQVGPGNHRIETPHRNGVENSAQSSTRTSRCPLSPVQVA